MRNVDVDFACLQLPDKIGLQVDATLYIQYLLLICVQSVKT